MDGDVDRVLRRLSRLSKKVQGDVQRLEKMAQAQRLGDALKPLMSQIRRGQDSVVAMDWVTGSSISIPLDPSLSPQANLERLFVQGRKGIRGLPLAQARLKTIQDQTRDLQILRQRWLEEEVGAGDALEIFLASFSQRKAKRPERTSRLHELDRWAHRFCARDESEIRVGKNARGNDRLTLGFTRGHDIWLHVRGCEGAHVVLRQRRGQFLEQEALLDAAHLAVHFSKARGEDKQEVTYTEARNVRKGKRAPPGQVQVARAKTLFLVLESTRLDRLLGRTPPKPLT